MGGIRDGVVFAVGDRTFSWKDVLVASLVWGDCQRIVDRARRALALTSVDAAIWERIRPGETESAADEFRYERDLVTAEEMERWLSGWGLDSETWLDWVEVDLLRQRVRDEECDPPLESQLDSLERFALAEAVFSGDLSRVARRLAARVALFERMQEDPGHDGLRGIDAIGAEPGPEPDQLRALRTILPDVSDGEVARGILDVRRIDACFRLFREMVLIPEAVDARVRAHQVDWMRVTFQVLQLPSEDMAREVVLSIREDGATLEEVAGEAGLELVEGTQFVEDLEPGVRDHLLAAQKGELLGPLKSGDGFAVFRVLDKALPSADDEEIVGRAEHSLLGVVVAREVDNRVTWRFPL